MSGRVGEWERGNGETGVRWKTRRRGRRVLVPLCLLCMRRAEPGVALCVYCGGSVLLFDD
jgi:hypothetical protein